VNCECNAIINMCEYEKCLLSQNHIFLSFYTCYRQTKIETIPDKIQDTEYKINH